MNDNQPHTPSMQELMDRARLVLDPVGGALVYSRVGDEGPKMVLDLHNANGEEMVTHLASVFAGLLALVRQTAEAYKIPAEALLEIVLTAGLDMDKRMHGIEDVYSVFWKNKPGEPGAGD